MRFLIIFSALFFSGIGYINFALADDPPTEAQQDIKTSNPMYDFLEPLTPEGLKRQVFPNTKAGCARWASFVFAISDQYPNNAAAPQMASMKIIEPMLQEVYEQVRTKGLVQTKIDTIKTYDECAKNAAPASNEKHKLRQAKKHKACKDLNDVVLGTLKAIKNKTPQSKTVRAFSGKEINIEGTVLQDIESPADFLVGQLYQKAQSESFDAAVNAGTAMSITCISRIY